MRPVLKSLCQKGYTGILSLFFVMCNFLLWAQQQKSDTTHVLHEIVISGYSSKIQGENVTNVEKLSLRETPVMGISLSEKLTNVAGIDNFSTGAGIGKPVIRGLSGNRIAVFSQGVRIENQQWGDEHGLGLDENGYEQVEVIKGPASLLYGSDAIGGVLFFADERYALPNTIEASLNSEFHSNTIGLRNMGAFKLSKKNLHLNLFGGYTTHKDYIDGNHKVIPNSRFNTGDLKTSLAYIGKLGKNGNCSVSTSLKYNYLNEKYGLTETDIDSANHYATQNRQPKTPYQHLNTHLLAWENILFFNNQSKLKIDLGYVLNKRQEFEEEENDTIESHNEEAALHMNLSTVSYNVTYYFPRWKKWDLVVGNQGMYQNNQNHGEEWLIPDATTLDVGMFVLTNFYYGQKAYWQSGIRIDNRNIKTVEAIGFSSVKKNYGSFNFSTGVFQPIVGIEKAQPLLTLRANLSTGFRTPNMFELLSNGIHEGVNRYEIGNSNLKNENGYQIDFSLHWRSKHLEAFISPYFNYIRNFIYLQPTGETIENFAVYHYVQTHAFLYGGETGFHLHPHPLDWLHIECSYANTFGQNANKKYLPLMPSQKIKANISIIFTYKKILKKYSFYLQNLYSFAQNLVAPEEITTSAYNILSCGAHFEFQINCQRILFNIAVNNLLNEKYFDHLSRYKNEGLYNMGRNFVVKVSLPIRAKM